ncbi:hypothetical protein [Providencia sp. PROV039]|uniref:hypothetical protein n=1 Tax=Providencia sp. PROV039 TaxID=2949770 RepID=UPI00234934BE|nr:hypothetical protein [Providencia sp. PROV039]
MDTHQSTTQIGQPIVQGVSQTVAKKPLQGVSGWLILPVIGLFYMLYKTVMRYCTSKNRLAISDTS